MTDSHKLGQRIIIIGSGGAGKSTLARQLGEKLGLPVIHLDKEFWQPGWVGTPREEFRQRQMELMQGERWLIDGNYTGTLPTRLERADTVLFLDYPWWLCLFRVIKRQLMYRGRTRPDLTEGCVERLQWEFVYWVVIDFPRRKRGRIMQLLEEKAQHARILMLKSPRDTSRLLAGLQ